MKCRQIISDRHRYLNIKGCGDAAWLLASNCLFCGEKACGDFSRTFGANVRDLEIEAIHGKT